jgi:hypothetical protein
MRRTGAATHRVIEVINTPIASKSRTVQRLQTYVWTHNRHLNWRRYQPHLRFLLSTQGVNEQLYFIVSNFFLPGVSFIHFSQERLTLE